MATLRARKRTPDEARATLEILAQRHPGAHCELDHANAFQLLVATVLSAQTTDVAVNKLTPGLFSAYPSAQTLARADTKKVEGLIDRIGMFRQKSKNIVGLAKALVETRALDPLDDQRIRPAFLTNARDHARHDADLVELGGAGIFDVGIALREDRNERTLALRERFGEGERLRAADVEWHRHAWKEHYVPERENGERLMGSRHDSSSMMATGAG